MSDRLVLLPDQRLVTLGPVLKERLAQTAGQITPANFPSLCPTSALNLLAIAIRRAGGDDGSIWIADQQAGEMAVAVNFGSEAERIAGFRQPLTKGLISAVFSAEQPLIENEVHKNTEHDPTLDRTLVKTTYAMIAVPFYFLNACRGVVTCVQLMDASVRDGTLTADAPPPPGFKADALEGVRAATMAAGQLFDYNLTKTIAGWENI